MAEDADGLCPTIRPKYQLLLPAFKWLGQDQVCHQRVNIFIVLNNFTIGEGNELLASERHQVTSTDVVKIQISLLIGMEMV